ncbi:MAG: hypothetical protein KGK12_10430, partial [Armatimonadetes bacterium]|nr:hypothetical protein [Armatimonadota bacterium]
AVSAVPYAVIRLSGAITRSHGLLLNRDGNQRRAAAPYELQIAAGMLSEEDCEAPDEKRIALNTADIQR